MTNTLRARLEAIDLDCETKATAEVDNLHASARSEEGKFRPPSPQAAEQIWLNLISAKEQEFIQEIAREAEPGSGIQGKEAGTTVEEMVDYLFDENRYLDRMQEFYREMSREAQLQGTPFEMEPKRLELLDSTYRMGVSDALRKARRNILAKFELSRDSDDPEDTSMLAQWQRYSTLSPWRLITTIVLLSLTSSLIAFIISSEAVQGWLERFGWSAGTGL
ncbi:MAG TPA: hypothetical protein VHB01_13050 [Nitrosospira sp.]|nr:hypothetical protein [Nitrosospira sp.]